MATKTTAAYRAKNATVKVGTQEKFPIGDAEHARSALKLINHAKPALTPSQQSSVRRRAAEFGVTPSKSSASSAKSPAKSPAKRAK